MKNRDKRNILVPRSAVSLMLRHYRKERVYFCNQAKKYAHSESLVTYYEAMAQGAKIAAQSYRNLLKLAKMSNGVQ